MNRRVSYRVLQDLLRQGRIAHYAGRDAEARVHYSEALEAARTAKDWSMESEALGGLGRTEVWSDPEAARELLTEAVALIEVRGKGVRVAGLKLHLALACFDSGDPARARLLVEANLPILDEQGQDLAVAFGAELLGMILVEEGRRTEALEQFRSAARRRRQPGGEEAAALRWRNRRDTVIAQLLGSPA